MTSSNTIIDLQSFKTQKFRSAVENIVSMMTSKDLDTLQHDVLSAPLRRSVLPSCLAEDFQQWLNDSYGPVEREDRLAPECQAETEALFLEELADGDIEVSAAIAVQLLATGVLSPREIQVNTMAEAR